MLLLRWDSYFNSISSSLLSPRRSIEVRLLIKNGFVLAHRLLLPLLQGTPRSSPGDEVVCFSSSGRGGGGETHEAHLVCPQLTGSTRRRRKDVAPWTAGQEQQQ